MGIETPRGESDEISTLYAKFKKKVGVFITVCRGLSEKKGYGEKRTADSIRLGEEGLFDGGDLTDENTISQLLASLDMSNYYSETVR